MTERRPTGNVISRVRRLAGCGTARAAVLSGLVITGLLASAGAAGAAGPAPAGSRPSPLARMVCSHEAAQKIDVLLGSTADVSEPTWTAHTYACRYRFPGGTVVLSVKELSSWSQTVGYFRQLSRSLRSRGPLYGLGQAAFQAGDGAVVVRKDWKVLVVDPSGLSAGFVRSHTTTGNAALTVAAAIMLCWKGD